MRVSAFLFFISIAGLLAIVQSAKSEEVSQNPAGRWDSVDLVRDINGFNPNKKNWQEEFFFKHAEFRANGTINPFPAFRWNNGWISDSVTNARAQFYIRQMNGSTYMFFPWLNGDVTERGQKPWYYVLKKVSGRQKRQDSPRTSQGLPRSGIDSKAGDSFQTIRAVDSVKEFDDVRFKDLSKLEPSAVAAVIGTLTFNEKIVWADTNAMPPEKKPDKILKDAMNPGLGVRQLHKQGITGKGVNVAIIDQPLYQDHPEFAGKIAAYFDTGCKSDSSMHGPAVASLLVGANCGTAPDAKLYYAAAPSWLKDSSYYAKAIDWIIEQNAKLPAGQKIRVVSVSAAPSGQGSPFDKNQQMWDEACARAEAAGILVLDCTQHRGFISSCWLNAASPDDINLCKPGYPGKPTIGFRKGNVLAPTSPRSTAEQYNKGEFSYTYYGEGGLSWAIPYVAGVLAMGWQVNPELGPEQMKEILFKSAAEGLNGAKIIDPQKFISMVKTAKPDSASAAPRPTPQPKP